MDKIKIKDALLCVLFKGREQVIGKAKAVL